MAIRLGKCTNFGNCSIADSRQTIQIPDGNDMLCPECRHSLAETKSAQKSSSLPIWLIVLLAVLVVFVGLLMFRRPNTQPEHPSAPAQTASTPAPASTEVSLRLCGSNTIGAQLAPALVSAFLKQNGAADVKITNTGTDEVQVSAPPSTQVVNVQAHGSSTAFEGLGNDSCDIGMASRKIKPAEIQSLSQLGDMTSPANEHVLGLDGIAIIVNRSNSVSALTIRQIAGLFSGSISSWTAVGGSGDAVKLYARDDKSGTYDTFKSLVLGSQALSANAQRYEDSRALSEAVASDVNGIGFVGLPYVGASKSVAVSEQGARALLPNRLTVATEDYILSRRLYLYTSATPKPLARKFVDFALGKAGQDVVAANGFVEQNVRVEESSEPVPGASAQYQQATRGAQRLSLDFRFRTGSSQLDNKALADIDRVTGLLADLHYTGKNVLLLGFADSTGTDAKNLVLSKDRAQAVASQFSQHGADPGLITGFGSDMPVASNSTDDGREKNRRVEIWLKK